MPIDTPVKRGSSINVGLPFGRVLPFPTGTIGVVQREFTAFAYVGIAASGPPAFIPAFARNRNAYTSLPVPQPQ